jgi:peptide-methionine (S)-S-oxide reductase
VTLSARRSRWRFWKSRRPRPSGATYGEFAAIDALLARGATLDLAVAAGLGRSDDVRNPISKATAESLDEALAAAVNHGHADLVTLLLNSGARINRFSPLGGHSHATPLHQAVASGQENIVRLLVERGADWTMRDIRYDGSPLDWAEHLGHTRIADYLREHGARQRP